MPTDLPSRPPAGDEGERKGRTSSPQALRGLQAVMAFVTLSGLVLLSLLPILRPGARSRPPQLVRIEAPSIGQRGSVARNHLELVAMAVHDAIERNLSGRPGLVWLEATEGAGASPGPIDPASSAPAPEVVRTTIECDSLCSAVLERVRTSDGHVLWRRGKVTLPLDDLPAIEQLIGEQLSAAYLALPRAQGAPELLAGASELRAYLELRQGATGSDPLTLARELAALRSTSPRFYETYLLEAELRRRGADPDSAALSRQAELLEAAHRIAPADRRPLLRLVPLLVALGRVGEARDRLADLDQISPLDPGLDALRRVIEQRPAVPSDKAEGQG